MRGLKFFGIALAGLIAAIVVLLFAMWLFVNPNDYKGRIVQAVKSATGRELELPGDLKLSVFPWIALELGPASLGNAPGFGTEPFAAVRHVAVRVKLLPLLRKRLQVGRIEIDGLELRLHRNTQGQGNWQGFGGGTAAAPHAEPDEPGTAALQDVSGVVITDSRVSYEDTVADQVNLTIGHVVAGASVPVTLKVNLVMSSGTPIKIGARGDFNYADNALRATGLVVKLDDSTLRGDAAITNLHTKAISFNLNLDRINLDRYLAAMRPAPGKAPPPPEVRSAEPTNDVLKDLQVAGTFAIGSATVVGVTASQVRANVAAKEGVTHISPATANLYGGGYSGDITLDERGSTPELKLDQSLTGVDIGLLLKDFAKLQRVSGRANVTVDLTGHGLASEEFIKSLSGHVNGYVTNGAIEGIDLWFAINRAIALLQKQALPAGKSSGRTRFDVFKASAVVANGVASTQDLTIASQNLRASGEGTANLVNGAINYQIKATILKETPVAKAASEATLVEVPLTITGTLKSPEVRLDLQAMARARVQQELEKHQGELQQRLQDVLKGLLK